MFRIVAVYELFALQRCMSFISYVYDFDFSNSSM